MDEIFDKWFEENADRFAHGQFDDKQIAYSAFLEGQKQALRIHDVVESVCECKVCGEPFGDTLSLYEHYNEEHNK